jgi:hypothetical protein
LAPEVVDYLFAGADPVVDDTVHDLVADGATGHVRRPLLGDLGHDLSALENHLLE